MLYDFRSMQTRVTTHHESFMTTDNPGANLRPMADLITAAQQRIRLPGFRVCLEIPIGELNSEQENAMYNLNCPVSCIATAKADLPPKAGFCLALGVSG